MRFRQVRKGSKFNFELWTLNLQEVMKKTISITLLLILFSLNALAQSSSDSTNKTVPADFKSDGCSLFPDGDYRNCCVEHDKTYYLGGSWRERRRADNKLFKCVADTKGFQNKLIAPVMWVGVRVGGVSFLPTPFRWGFGQKKIPKSAAANSREK